MNGSFPVRERGLKHIPCISALRALQSFPVRERGLKLLYRYLEKRGRLVVPRAGTWIETPSIW